MPKIKLDDIEFNTEDLSDHALLLLKSLQFSEMRLREIELELSAHKTAKNAYMHSLKIELKTDE